MADTHCHASAFGLRQVVTIDDDPVHCRVTAILIRGSHNSYELSWMNNGESRTAWVEEFRLSAIDSAKVGF